jgi:ABC-type microcin C transport system permease subunit YejB
MFFEFDFVAKIYYTYRVCNVIEKICEDKIVLGVFALVIVALSISVPLTIYLWRKKK